MSEWFAVSEAAIRCSLRRERCDVMKSVSKLFCLALLVCGVTVEARGQVTATPVDCLQYEVCVNDDGSGTSFYLTDFYQDGPSPCTNGPYEDYAIALSGLPVPQVCPGCNPRNFALRKPCSPLREAFPINHKFMDRLPPTAKSPKINGVENVWEPKAVTRVLQTQWVRVQAHDRAIPVKLYTVEVDFGKSKLPADRMPSKVVRILQVGFEMKGFPADIDERHVRVLDPKRWATNPDCSTACTVKLDDETEPFFVITKHQVFEASPAPAVPAPEKPKAP